MGTSPSSQSGSELAGSNRYSVQAMVSSVGPYRFSTG